MKRQLIGLLAAAALALGALPAVAQDHKELNCLGLSDDDCAFVQQSVANISNLESFTYNFTFSGGISNASQIVQGIDTSITAQGSGAFAIDASQRTADAPYAGVSLALDVNGTVTNDDGDTSGGANLIIADGNVYMQDADSGAWKGVSLADLQQHPDALSFSFMGMDIPAAQVMQAGTGLSMMASSQGGGLMADGVDLSALLQVPDFLNQTRLPDETIDGQTTAVFGYTADIGVLMANEDVQAAIAQMSDSAGNSEDPMAQQMAMMLPILLQNTTGTVTLTRWIGTDDGLPRRIAFNLDSAVDLGIKSGNGTPVPPIEIKLAFTVDLTGINSTDAPAPPEGATLVPAESFMSTSG